MQSPVSVEDEVNTASVAVRSCTALGPN